MTCRGEFCESCGICVCTQCVKPANRQLVCKLISSRETTLKHHWIKGNLLFESVCAVCEEQCGDSPQLDDYRCCMCQRTVHTQCKENMAQVCDLGRFAAFVVAPNRVQVRSIRTVRGRRLMVSAVTTPPSGQFDKQWTPLIVIGNRRAGNNEGQQVLTAFRRYLNPAQVNRWLTLPSILPRTVYSGATWWERPAVAC